MSMLKRIVATAVIIMLLVSLAGCFLKEKPQSGVELPDTQLGDVSFTADTNRRVHKEYTADSDDFSLSVNDAQGYVWTLEIS